MCSVSAAISATVMPRRIDGHRPGRHLVVGDVAADVAVDERADFVVGELARRRVSFGDPGWTTFMTMRSGLQMTQMRSIELTSITPSRSILRDFRCSSTTPRTIALSLSPAVSAVATTSWPLVSLRDVGRADVGDRREAEDAQAGVDGDDHFGDGRHADGVAAEAAEHADLGAGFVGRAEHGDVRRRGGRRNRRAARSRAARSPSSRSYGDAHVGEPRAEAVVVHADERVAIEQS